MTIIFGQLRSFKVSKVCVASTNPVKLKAIQTAFEALFEPHEGDCEGDNKLDDGEKTKKSKSISFVTVGAQSDVSDQPMGDTETLTGARNRIHNARKLMPDCDFYCGLEGGCALEPETGDMACFAWIVVQDRDGQREGRGKTGVLYLPPEVAKLVKGGMELGHANDSVFSQLNSKHKGGAVGLLTDGAVTRHLYYEQAAILALIPFHKPQLYPINP